MKRPLKILHLMPDPPNTRGGGGAMRNYHFARALAETFDATIAICQEQSKKPESYDGIEEIASILRPPTGFNVESRHRRQAMGGFQRAWTVMTSVHRERGKLLIITGRGQCALPARSLLHRFYGFLLWAEAAMAWRLFDCYQSSSLVRYEEFQHLLPQIRRIHSRTPFDLIWCEHSYLYPFVEALKREMPGVRTVCNTHNSERMLLARLAKSASLASARRWLRMETLISKRWERSMMANADMVIACSDVDSALFAQLQSSAKEKPTVIANGVDCDYFRPAATCPDDPPTVLFTGSAGYFPNDDAVAWLVDEIFPLVLKQVPGCVLQLAGRNADARWGHHLSDRPWLRIQADVPDMRPLFHQASVVTVPLRCGSGTRLKILEAMAMGKAIVSTAVGAEGLRATHGRDILIEDSSSGIAGALASLLHDAPARHALGQNARRLVEDHYHWDALMEEAIRKVSERFIHSGTRPSTEDSSK